VDAIAPAWTECEQAVDNARRLQRHLVTRTFFFAPPPRRARRNRSTLHDAVDGDTVSVTARHVSRPQRRIARRGDLVITRPLAAKRWDGRTGVTGESHT
jgi:hypothetical protein